MLRPVRVLLIRRSRRTKQTIAVTTINRILVCVTRDPKMLEGLLRLEDRSGTAACAGTEQES